MKPRPKSKRITSRKRSKSFEKPVNPHEVAPPSEPQPPEDYSGADSNAPQYAPIENGDSSGTGSSTSNLNTNSSLRKLKLHEIESLVQESEEDDTIINSFNVKQTANDYWTEVDLDAVIGSILEILGRSEKQNYVVQELNLTSGNQYDISNNSAYPTRYLLLRAFLHPDGGNGKIVISEHWWSTVSYDEHSNTIYIDKSVLLDKGHIWGVMQLAAQLQQAYVENAATKKKYDLDILGFNGIGALSDQLAKANKEAFEEAAGQAAEILENAQLAGEIALSVVNDGVDVYLTIRDLSDPNISTRTKIPIAMAGMLPFVSSSGVKGIAKGMAKVDAAKHLANFTPAERRLYTIIEIRNLREIAENAAMRLKFVDELELPKDAQRALLREALKSNGTGKIAHHLIPLESITEFRTLMQRAAGGGFNINGRNNGYLLESIDHIGGHPKYNRIVLEQLSRINRQAKGLSDEEIAELIQEIADVLRKAADNETFKPWF